MKAVFICSPYSGDIERNSKKVRHLCYTVAKNGFAPFAPHIFCTEFLNEDNDRKLGIDIGLEWLERADEVWVCTENITKGMEQEIQHAIKVGKPIRFYHELVKRRLI